DVAQWKGHKAYIEILDNGDEQVAVSEIRFCDQPPPDAPDGAMLEMLDDNSINYLDDLAGKYGEARLFDLINFDLGHPHPKPDIDIASGMWIGKYNEIEKNIPAPTRVVAAADGTGVNQRVFIR